jgi:hypothetical protein
MRSKARQRSGNRPEDTILVLIDEINTWIASLKGLDDSIKSENMSLPPAERELANFYQRGLASIAVLARMGREDRVVLWGIGQNPNITALGLDGVADRSNLCVVAVGFGRANMTINTALSNQTMFPYGAELLRGIKEHQTKQHQIAASSRFPDDLMVMPNYSGRDQLSPKVLAKYGVGKPERISIATKSVQPPIDADPWIEEPEEAIAITQTKSAAEILAKLKAAGLITIEDLEVLTNANP